jgi:AraC-like DNA-binding protein
VSAARHSYRSVRYGVDTLPSGLVLERHRHTLGYATVVLGGAFVEASFSGRASVQPGDVLLHGHFDCHANWGVGRLGLQILRLPWAFDDIEGRFRVRDADALVRIAERDPFEASEALRCGLEVGAFPGHDWPVRLARALADEPSLSLRTWATDAGLAPETVSRGFRRAFGVSPKLFRLEVRTRRAWSLVVRSRRQLTTIAHDLAFADLAHMSRSIAALTGRSPSAWRQLRSS